MREVNFSVPNANRASVGITTALYDRRALDCTSTLPLVNSLNHLAYLTTSSPRIREILTVDGGIERLVYILKNGKSKDMLDTWKWSLAFQCVVNVAVRGSDSKGADSRGSENIRTRVIEADIVPVVTTILDNYMQVVEKVRARQEEVERQKSASKHGSSKRPLSREDQVFIASNGQWQDRRRQAPPPIDVTPSPFAPTNRPFNGSSNTPPPPPSHGYGGRIVSSFNADSVPRPANPFLNVPTLSTPQTQPGSSQPNTPTIPLALGRLPVPTTRYPTRRRSASAGYLLPVTSQQDLSMSGDSDDGDAGPAGVDHVVTQEAPNVEDTTMSSTVEPSVLGDATASVAMPDPDVTGDGDVETFNITHRSLNGSIIDPIAPPADATIAMSPPAPPFASAEAQPPNMPPMMNAPYPLPDRIASAGLVASMPRDEDVIMALQLLAYVSKYTHLRPYFEQSHLVPKLKIQRDLDAYDAQCSSGSPVEPLPEEDNEFEYCQPDDYNIFPLVEKFTVRHHSSDMNYWACVVMRNLCRKDKSRGDIRQCAYWKCGKWEEFARQFAKCRRCRQTKYCSKECQKAGWIFHRHWCEPARNEPRDGQQRSSRHAGAMDVDGEGAAPS